MPPIVQQKKNFGVRLPLELIREVKLHAAANDRSVSRVVEDAIKDHLHRKQRPQPAATP